MLRMWVPMIGALALVGCKKSPEPVQGPGFEEPPPEEGTPPEGWQQLSPDEGPIEDDPTLQGLPEANAPGTGVQPEAGADGRPARMRAALEAARLATEQVRLSEDLRHEALMAALDNLADAVASLPEDQGASDEIRAFADRIHTSDPASLEHADWTEQALLRVADVLDRTNSFVQLPGFADHLRAVRAQVETLDPAVPLLDQREAVAVSLLAVIDALTVFAPPPTG
jgi:hypothetical protein